MGSNEVADRSQAKCWSDSMNKQDLLFSIEAYCDQCSGFSVYRMKCQNTSCLLWLLRSRKAFCQEISFEQIYHRIERFCRKCASSGSSDCDRNFCNLAIINYRKTG